MRIAFLFPGQGSQKVGMGADLVERHPHLKERYFDVAADVLGFDLLGLCTDGPEDALRSTDNTQPAIFTVSMALLAFGPSVLAILLSSRPSSPLSISSHDSAPTVNEPLACRLGSAS